METNNEKLSPLSPSAMMGFFDGVVEQYDKAIVKHPSFATVIINEAASLEWIRENLMKARALLKKEQSADHVTNCEWVESLEAWKMAVEASTLKELDDCRKNFDVEVKQTIATMIRYWQLGMKTIARHRKELEGKGGK